MIGKETAMVIYLFTQIASNISIIARSQTIDRSYDSSN